MVLSASSITSYETTGDTYSIFLKQLLFTLIGIFGLFLGSRKRTKIWNLLTTYSFPLGAIILISPIFFGRTINGNKAWIGFGIFTIQPSEFVKLLLILWLSRHIVKYNLGLDRTGINDFVPSVLSLVFVPLFFMVEVMLGKDLGTAGIYAVILFGMLYLSGAPRLFISTLSLAVTAGGGLFAFSSPARWHRFAAVWDPFAPSVYKYAGWQPAHSIMGLASGGFFGVGLGASKQKWANLGEAHTDFIFSIIGEEMGLFGTLLVLTFFGILIFSILRISMKSQDQFYRYASAGVAIWFLAQMVVNICTSIGVFPVIGVTLPLVSYGGSSLIADYLGIALVLFIARQNDEINEALEEEEISKPVSHYLRKRKEKKVAA
jgi:cell division protein FtsW